jgi:hypothetical protein
MKWQNKGIMISGCEEKVDGLRLIESVQGYFIAYAYPRWQRMVVLAPELAEKLEQMTALFQSALLNTTPEIAKEGMEFVREARALIKDARKETIP